MKASIQGTSRVYGIIGYPVTHSRSPVMQNLALEADGRDAVFVPFEVSPDLLPEAIRGMRALGIAGFNVTIPHKCAVMPLLDHVDAVAAIAGAVNTVVVEEHSYVGYNTDGDGLVRSLAVDLAHDPAGDAVLVYGAGGAVRGALEALCRHGVRSVRLYNRTATRGAVVLDALTPHFPEVDFQLITDLDRLNEVMKETNLFLQGSSLGMHGEVLPGVDVALLPKDAIVYDMVYAPKPTPLICSARLRGLACCDGLGMLAGQGELAYRLWHGHLPPEGLMRSALQSIERG